MKTDQAVRNIRKFKRKVEIPPKGRMVTDDYGNKLSVKKKADGTFGRRHTLSRGKKRAERLGSRFTGYNNPNGPIKVTDNDAVNRHADSFRRRSKYPLPTRNANKELYHGNRNLALAYNEPKHIAESTKYAKAIHAGTRRKHKDFTK